MLIRNDFKTHEDVDGFFHLCSKYIEGNHQAGTYFTKELSLQIFTWFQAVGGLILDLGDCFQALWVLCWAPAWPRFILIPFKEYQKWYILIYQFIQK